MIRILQDILNIFSRVKTHIFGFYNRQNFKDLGLGSDYFDKLLNSKY